MSNLISPETIANNSVYGIRQAQYTVGKESGKNFTDAIMLASFKQAVAIEDATTAYSHVVTARQTKIDELSEILADLARVAGSFDHDVKTSDEVTVSNSPRVKRLAEKYEISLNWTDGNKMTWGNVQKAKTDVQYAIEREDNDIQQDIVTLQSYLSKRDNAYSNAAKIVRKSNNAASATISDIGA